MSTERTSSKRRRERWQQPMTRRRAGKQTSRQTFHAAGAAHRNAGKHGFASRPAIASTARTAASGSEAQRQPESGQEQQTGCRQSGAAQAGANRRHRHPQRVRRRATKKESGPECKTRLTCAEPQTARGTGRELLVRVAAAQTESQHTTRISIRDERKQRQGADVRWRTARGLAHAEQERLAQTRRRGT